MGAVGREIIAAQFALDKMIDAYERCYAQLADGRRR